MVEIVKARLDDLTHQAAVIEMIDAYSRDPMGDLRPLDGEVRQRLIPGLRAHPTTVIVLAFASARPVGIAVCFRGFSTFSARPLLNIHDFMVVPEFRGKSVGRNMLKEVERIARELGCCKLTLEVQINNVRAQKTYTCFGFQRYILEESAGAAIFMHKPLV